ncbi:hypothetical protein C0J45_9897 [Silurus meridionalis]|nr:hypothetical protein C0J45_9897 [Silurus meridionalis]
MDVHTDPISADPHITVEAHVGSTALLPCSLSKDFSKTPHVRWRADNEFVFERSFDGTHEGPGYKGRVDVPEDELRKGNCSLVLKDVRITDHVFYRSFVMEHVEATNTNKIQEINRVQLNVYSQRVSAQVGSTAVLPCDWKHLSIQTPHVEWRIGDEIVFERLGKESFQGEGYEGRVDVPEEELLKGNCSLVLKNIVMFPPTDPISADPPITVEAHVGSTALLPCTLCKDFSKTPHVLWRGDNKVVFERSFTDTHEGPGYEGRVDVLEDELRKGNCSLVLKDVRITDHTFYRSFIVEHVEATNYKKSTQFNSMRVSAQVGSTAVLPCDWRYLSIQTPHVEWRIGNETVFERLGKESSQGKGYEGRVDVPEEELLKGNCSLVLKNVSVTDEALYSSYMVVINNYKLVQKVKLSVREKSEERKDDPSAPSVPLSEDPSITVEAHVGSTALLPCHLRKVFTQTPHIRWHADNEVVFERSFDVTHEGPGYEGRVDIPEEELCKGNCSLVLKDVRFTDHTFYRSFVVEHVEDTNTDKSTEINKIQLDVFQSVSAQVGSTAVLPCDWRHLSIETPHVEWSIGREIVFERKGKESSQGKGYEGRVDVPEEELLKGNCSLVLNQCYVTDETLYSSYILMTDTKKPVLVQNIKVSVSDGRPIHFNANPSSSDFDAAIRGNVDM